MWIIVAGVVAVVVVIGAIIFAMLPANSSNSQSFSCTYRDGPLPVTISSNSSNSTNVSITAESSIFMQHWMCGASGRDEFSALLVDDLWGMPVVPASGYDVSSGPNADQGYFLWVYTDNGGKAAYNLYDPKNNLRCRCGTLTCTFLSSGRHALPNKYAWDKGFTNDNVGSLELELGTRPNFIAR